MTTTFQARSVQQVMQDAGLYEEGSRDALREKFIEEETVDIGGKSYRLSRISRWDAKLFTNELDGVLAHLNPRIHDIYAKYSVSCFDLVRLVNTETKQGFGGAGASGNALDFTLFNARQFQDPDGAVQTRRSSWVRAIASTGSKYMFEDRTGAAHSIEQTMAEEEGMIFLAWYNPASTPCVDAFQITMNSVAFDHQDLDFDRLDSEDGDVIVELKQPWTLPPEQSGAIQTYYYQTGTDELRPIGMWIKQSKNMRAMATP